MNRYQHLSQFGPDDYLAHDPLLNRQVRIQVTPQQSDEQFQWARKLALAGGPLVQRLFDLGVSAEGSYLIREVVQGRSLEEIGPDRSLLTPLLDSLESIHRIGLQHGDLRPANAILTPEGVLRLTNLCYHGRDDLQALTELLNWFGIHPPPFTNLAELRQTLNPHP